MIPKKSTIEKVNMTKRCFVDKPKKTPKTKNRQISLVRIMGGGKDTKKIYNILNVNKGINKWRSGP